MKRYLFFILIIASSLVSAQSPQGINYQAVVRNLDGNPIINKEIKIRVSILNESPSGNIIYREEHLMTTSLIGLINLTIGEGQNKFGQMESIEWGNKLKYIKVEYSEDSTNNYTLSNTSQLKSVPYALFAEKTNIKAGEGIKIDGNVIMNTGDLDNNSSNEIQNLSINGNSLSISNGNTVQLPTSGNNSMQILTTDEILSQSNKPQGTMILSSTNNSIYYYAGNNWYKLESTIQQNGNEVVVKDCLIAYYNFDEANGNDYNNEYNGTITGVVFSTDVNSKINTGKSASFNGNDRITISKNVLKNLNQGSITFWVKSSAEGTILFGDTQGSQSFVLRIASSNGKKILFYNENGSFFNYDMTQFFNNSWNHIAVTISSSQRKLYVNGIELEVVNNNQGMTGTSFGSGMLIGSRESISSWNLTGKLDNLRIYCKALTENEIKTIYNSGQ